MKYTIALALCILLFPQCHPAYNVQPTGTYDTLGIHWTWVKGTNIDYYFEDFSQQSGYATQFVNLHEAAYTQLNAIFDAQLPQKLRFFVWTDTALAAQLLGSPLGFTDQLHCTVYTRPDETIGHLMTFGLSYWAWGRTPTAITTFVNEGLGTAFDLTNTNRIEAAKAALSGQNIQSVTDLWTGSYQNAPEEVLFPIAAAFINYLYQQNQPARFDSLIMNQTMISAQNIYGTARLDSLIANFNSLIGL